MILRQRISSVRVDANAPLATEKTSGYPPEVGRFTDALCKTARSRGLAVILKSVDLPQGDDWATVKYSWESASGQHVSRQAAQQIVLTTLDKGEWADSVRVGRAAGTDASASPMTLEIRVGRGVKRRYLLKIFFLFLLCAGVVYLLLLLTHLLWHVVNDFQDYAAFSV